MMGKEQAVRTVRFASLRKLYLGKNSNIPSFGLLHLAHVNCFGLLTSVVAFSVNGG